jgi:ABC-type sugar transport system permease subunit
VEGEPGVIRDDGLTEEPQLRPTLMVVTTLQVIAGLKIFVPIYVLTSGGPANASLSL